MANVDSIWKSVLVPISSLLSYPLTFSRRLPELWSGRGPLRGTVESFRWIAEAYE